MCRPVDGVGILADVRDDVPRGCAQRGKPSDHRQRADGQRRRALACGGRQLVEVIQRTGDVAHRPVQHTGALVERFERAPEVAAAVCCLVGGALILADVNPGAPCRVCRVAELLLSVCGGAVELAGRVVGGLDSAGQAVKLGACPLDLALHPAGVGADYDVDVAIPASHVAPSSVRVCPGRAASMPPTRPARRGQATTSPPDTSPRGRVSSTRLVPHPRKVAAASSTSVAAGSPCSSASPSR